MSMQVIHIEDEGPLRDILKIALRAAEPDLTLFQFFSGDEARACLEQHGQKTDLFVIDIRLPGSLNGVQIAQLTRELNCPGFIVLTSAYGMPDRALLKSLDCEYLPKPWHIPDLVGQVPRYKLANRSVAQPVVSAAPAAKPALSGASMTGKLQTALLTDKAEGSRICTECGQRCAATNPVCPNCGSAIGAVETIRLPISETQRKESDRFTPTQIGGVFAVGPQMVVLEIDGHKLTLPPQEKILIGRRVSAGGDSQVDVDLSHFKANLLGVSRRHLQIMRRDMLVYATDLGTLNGTWLNNRSLTSYSERLLRNGDELRLGQLKMRVWLG